ncbi:MAG: TonB-dependent receptor [Pseudomonadales bacterium]
MEEVVVSATRREEAIMDIPLSIQAITSERLELPTYHDINELYNLVPGAVSFGQKAPLEEGIQLRGSGIVQSGTDDQAAPVGYYVDDIPYIDVSTPSQPPIGTFDLERVEIIRGPQGTSYGQDSVGGSVILRTSRVDLEKFGYKLRVGFTDVKDVKGTGYDLGGVINIPLADNVFGVRISFLREYDPGYGEVFERPDIDNPLEDTRDSFRFKALWNASDWLELELTHSYWNTEYNFLPGTNIRDSRGGTMLLNPLTTAIGLAVSPDGVPENDYDVSWSTFRMVIEQDWAELTYSLGYVDAPNKETNSEFLLSFGESGIVFNQPAETLTQELRIVSAGDSRLQWLAGFFSLSAESDSGGATLTPAFFFGEVRSDPVESDVWAIYGEVDYALSDSWSLLAGMRFHDEKRVYTNEYATIIAGGPPTHSPTTVTDTSFDHTSYRFGLTWTPNDNGLVYLTRSTANRAPLGPGENVAVLEAAGITPPGEGDPAELTNTELGTKWTLLDGRMQLELVYARGNWKDVPMWAQLDIPPTPISLGIGGTDALVETWEIILAWSPTDNLTLSYSGAFTDTEVTSVPSDEEVTDYPRALQKGGELFNYSPATHNFDISYNRELASGWGIFAGASYVTRDKVDGLNVFSFAATEYAPSEEKYSNLALNAGTTKGPYTLTFSVNNATDFDGRYLPRSEGVIGGNWALIPQPRSMTLQLTYNRL